MPTTSNHQLPYPLGTSPNNVPADIQALADRLEALLSPFSSSTAALRPPAGVAGRWHFATDTTGLSLDTGGTWRSIPLGSLADYLLKAGGVLTGFLDLADNQLRRPELRDLSETLTTVGAAGASLTLNLETSNAWNVTLSAACTVSVSNPPAGARAGQFTLWLTEPATLWAVTWPASFRWPSGTAPTLVANKTFVIVGVTKDIGATWQMSTAGPFTP